MRLKSFLAFSFLSFVCACGGNGSGSGSGQIDYSSATVVEDLTTQLAALDPNISVQSNGDGTINLTKGSDTLVITPGQSSSAVIDFSGTLYNVQVSASGKYTYSPAASPSSTSAYISSAKSLVSDLDDVTSKLGLDSLTGVVDLTTGTKNSSAVSAPDTVTLSGNGTGSISGSLSGWSTSSSLSASQTMTITHNFVDDTVRAAHLAGWDGTGVGLTVLDGKDPSWEQTYKINQSVAAKVTLTDGTTTETETGSNVAVVNFSITHGALVYGIAAGLDWKTSLEGYYGVTMNNNCSASTSTETVDQLTTKTTIQISSNHCDKIGVATGATASFSELVDNTSSSYTTWYDLIELKNKSDKIEILNFSFANSTNNALSFSDNHNVVIVDSAGNDSEENNGYDIYADGRKVDNSTDILEIMEVAITESAFADNLIAVGALDANDSIAVYSSIAGSDYDGSSYAFVVEDGTVKFDVDTTTNISGNLSMTKSGTTLSGTYEASTVESLKISTQGTSFAAPRVSGKIAITAQKFPNLNAEQLVNLAKYTAIDLGDTGVDRIYGHGKINLTGMLSPVGRLK